MNFGMHRMSRTAQCKERTLPVHMVSLSSGRPDDDSKWEATAAGISIEDMFAHCCPGCWERL